jgi:S1-C subfamily serine protease
LKVYFRVESGALEGQTLTFTSDRISVGRHPSSEFRFDAARDLEVSAQHAVILRRGHLWFVRDLGSKNGTFVNGVRTKGDQALSAGDQLSFGASGPSALFLLSPPPETATGFATTLESTAAAARAEIAASDETLRVRARVAKETRSLRILVGILAVGLVGVVTLLVGANVRQQGAWEAERTRMLTQVDSLLLRGAASVASLEGEMEGVAQALAESEDEVRQLRVALEDARSQNGEESLDELRAQLQAATVALEKQQLAAAIDFRAIEARSGPAVAAIWVDFGADEVLTATAFSAGDGGLLVTNRHVVSGAQGDRRPRRLAVRHSGSRETWPAEVVAVSSEWDVALIRVTGGGAPPEPVRFNGSADTIPAGRPLLLIGFPLGGEAVVSQEAGVTGARPITSTAVLLGMGELGLELQGYGAEGASGSPVFDEAGEVVGILQGSVRGTNDQILVAVPASAAIDLIRGSIERVGAQSGPSS